ncbi:hypothetical protein CSA08_01970, partial [Candidatus Gracilibacteria bacterium]
NPELKILDKTFAKGENYDFSSNGYSFSSNNSNIFKAYNIGDRAYIEAVNPGETYFMISKDGYDFKKVNVKVLDNSTPLTVTTTEKTIQKGGYAFIQILSGNPGYTVTTSSPNLNPYTYSFTENGTTIYALEVEGINATSGYEEIVLKDSKGKTKLIQIKVEGLVEASYDVYNGIGYTQVQVSGDPMSYDISFSEEGIIAPYRNAYFLRFRGIRIGETTMYLSLNNEKKYAIKVKVSQAPEENLVPFTLELPEDTGLDLYLNKEYKEKITSGNGGYEVNSITPSNGYLDVSFEGDYVKYKLKKLPGEGRSYTILKDGGQTKQNYKYYYRGIIPHLNEIVLDLDVSVLGTGNNYQDLNILDGNLNYSFVKSNENILITKIDETSFRIYGKQEGETTLQITDGYGKSKVIRVLVDLLGKTF